MKKILLGLCFALAVNSAMQAQTVFKHTVSNPTGLVSNTSSDTMNLQVSTSRNASIGIQYKLSRSAGTAAGTAVLTASIDGVNYVTTSNSFSLTNVATQTVIWVITAPVYRYYRIITSGATTVTATTLATVWSNQF